MHDKLLTFFKTLDPNAPISDNSQALLDFQHFNNYQFLYKPGCLVVDGVAFFVTQKMKDVISWCEHVG